MKRAARMPGHQAESKIRSVRRISRHIFADVYSFGPYFIGCPFLPSTPYSSKIWITIPATSCSIFFLNEALSTETKRAEAIARFLQVGPPVGGTQNRNRFLSLVMNLPSRPALIQALSLR